MGEELNRSLIVLAERGTPRGAAEVLEAARDDSLRRDALHEVEPIRSRWRRGVAVAAGAAVAVLVVVGAVILVVRPFGGDTAERLPAMTLTPAPDVDPVRVSTVIGDIEFTTLQFPADDGFAWLDDLTATPFGPVVIDDGSLWWSTDYQTWQRDPQAHGQRVTVVGDDLIVYDGGGGVRYEWSGDGWTRHERLDLPRAVDKVVFGRRGAVAVSVDILMYSTDGLSFTEAERGPDLDVFVAKEGVPDEDREYGDCRLTAFATTGGINTVLATDTGFVAFTSAFHPDGLICEPLLWFSSEGNTWELVSQESPFGELSSIDPEIVEREGRFVATGEIGPQGPEEDPRATVWASDDGLRWQRVDLELDRAAALAAGEMGWILIEYDAMWLSADGLTWDGPHELPGALGTGWFVPQVAVGSEAIFGIGTWPGTWDRAPVIGRLHD
jgi:hypothetical protein